MTQFGRGSAQLTAASQTFVLEKHLDLVNVATVAALLINEFWIFKFPQCGLQVVTAKWNMWE